MLILINFTEKNRKIKTACGNADKCLGVGRILFMFYT